MPKKRKRTRLPFAAIALLVVGVLGAVYALRGDADTKKSNPSSHVVLASQTQTSNNTQQPKASTTTPEGYKQLTGVEFGTLYNSFVYPNTEPIESLPAITGDDAVDAYIRKKAEARGYRVRSIPVTQIAKVPDAATVDDDLLQPLALEGWNKIRDLAQKDGMPLKLISAYRSPEYQRNLFLQRLQSTGVVLADLPSGAYDAQLDKILKTTSIPGYSRHHSGFTVDFACDDGSLEAFVNTPCFTWISKNNYENAKKTGWIPSYPDGAGLQGPDPEPWEYVWVGTDVLKK